MTRRRRALLLLLLVLVLSVLYCRGYEEEYGEEELVDEHVCSHQILHLVFAKTVSHSQLHEVRSLIGGVMVNVHRRVGGS
jgi:hypothetical protein